MTIKGKGFRIVKTILAIWGAISLVGLLSLAGYVYYSFGPGNKNVDDKASKSDVRFVLNWCGLGDERIEKVIHSHISARSFSGDHLDAYSIKIKRLSIEEIEGNPSATGRWYRGDNLPKLLDEALSLACGFDRETPWLPKESEIRSKDFYVYPWSIYCHGISPSGAELIFVKPTDKMVYYVSVKM